MLQILQWLLSYKYCVKSESESISCSVVADSLWPHGLKAPLSMDFSSQKSWSAWSFPFSRQSSWPRDWTQVSCIAGRFFIIWATQETLTECLGSVILSSPSVLQTSLFLPSRLCDNYQLPCQCSCSPRLPDGELQPKLQVLLEPRLLQGVFPL